MHRNGLALNGHASSKYKSQTLLTPPVSSARLYFAPWTPSELEPSSSRSRTSPKPFSGATISSSGSATNRIGGKMFALINLSADAHGVISFAAGPERFARAPRARRLLPRAVPRPRPLGRHPRLERAPARRMAGRAPQRPCRHLREAAKADARALLSQPKKSSKKIARRARSRARARTTASASPSSSIYPRTTRDTHTAAQSPGSSRESARRCIAAPSRETARGTARCSP